MRNRDNSKQEELVASDVKLPIEHFLEAGEEMLRKSKHVVKMHCGYQEMMQPRYEKIDMAFHHAKDLLTRAHHSRHDFNIPESMSVEYYKTLRLIHIAERDIRRVSSGKRLAYWKKKLARYQRKLKFAKSGRCEEGMRLSHLYIVADQGLHKLQKAADEISCWHKADKARAQRAVDEQLRVVEELGAMLHAFFHNPTIIELEEKISRAELQIEKYTHHSEEVLDEYREQIALHQETIMQVQKNIDYAYVRHCSTIDAAAVQAIIQMMAHLRNFKKEFDHHGDLKESRDVLFRAMQDLRCDDIGLLNTRDLYNQYKHMDKRTRTEIVECEPNGLRFLELMGQRVPSNDSGKVSILGMYSSTRKEVHKEVHESTLEKRAHFVRTKPVRAVR